MLLEVEESTGLTKALRAIQIKGDMGGIQLFKEMNWMQRFEAIILPSARGLCTIMCCSL